MLLVDQIKFPSRFSNSVSFKLQSPYSSYGNNNLGQVQYQAAKKNPLSLLYMIRESNSRQKTTASFHRLYIL